MRLKKILYTGILLTILSCGTQKYVTNTNTNCTDTYISKELYSFNIEEYKNKVKEVKDTHIRIKTDTSKIHTWSSKNRGIIKYNSVRTFLKNNKITYLVYDSIGRLIQKFYLHGVTDIGERIIYKYSNLESKKPIEISKVNYDTIYPICWKEALHIAKRKGIKLKEVEIDVYYPLDEDEKKDSTRKWVISDNKHTMTVNVYTGKASKLRKKYISGHGPM